MSKRILLVLCIIGISIVGVYFLFKRIFPPPIVPRAIPVPSSYPVLYVLDGDTISVSVDGKDERVRLIGIDAPEMNVQTGNPMCFSEEATAFAKGLLIGKTVRLEPDPTQDDRDKYNRLLRYVFLDDGMNVNRTMVAQGFAKEYTYLGKPYQFQQQFEQAQADARRGSLGMWAAGACNASEATGKYPMVQ